MSPETIAYVRDWVIIIWGGIATLAALAILIVTVLLYRKVSGLVTSIRAAVDGVREFGARAAEQFSALAPLFRIFSRRKRDDREEEREDGRHETARDRG